MKRITLLSACILFSAMSLIAQNRDTISIKTSDDTIEVIVRSKEKSGNDTIPEMEKDDKVYKDSAPKSPKKLKDVRMRWCMLDYGMSTYTGDGGINLPAEYPYSAFEQNLWKSSNWNLHVFKMRINAYRHHVNVVTGLSFEFYRYNWVNNYIITEGNPTGSSAIIPVQITDGNGNFIKFDKNRMYSSFLTIPLMLNFESNPRKSMNSFHLSAGGFVGFKLASNVRLEGDGYKERLVKDNFNMNNFRYGLTGQIGYGPVTLYANYSLVPLFKDAPQTTGFTQPELFPLNFGVQLIGF